MISKRSAKIALGLALASTGAIATAETGVEYSWALALLPSGAEFKLEIADDPASRWRGYRYREHLPADEGMLFVFPDSGHLEFEMKDCLIALDIIFLDPQLRVVDIAHDQQPCVPERECEPIRPMHKARYVLEIAGGTAAREGLESGQRVSILAEPPIP